MYLGFPGGSDIRESACNKRLIQPSQSPEVKCNHTQYSQPEEFTTESRLHVDPLNIKSRLQLEITTTLITNPGMYLLLNPKI